jgi:hypothetical protein
MYVGMLWYDGASGTGLAQRLEKAADYYRRKYRRDPDLCLVHPSMVEAGHTHYGKLAVRAYQPILPDHFWIGVEERG